MLLRMHVRCKVNAKTAKFQKNERNQTYPAKQSHYLSPWIEETQLRHPRELCSVHAGYKLQRNWRESEAIVFFTDTFGEG